MGLIWKERYEERRKIGQGGSGSVYLAWDRMGQCEVAVKEYAQEMVARQESYILRKLSYERFPRVIDEGRRDEISFLVMSYIEGENLGEILERRRLRTDEVYSFGIQICEMFLYLHSRVPAVIYRDLKPDNLILRRDKKLVLIDFGAAREYKKGQRRDTILLGTKGFAAPEQFGNMGQTDQKTDIYTIGRLFYLFLGKEDGLERCKERELVQIIRKCISVDREKRYDSVKDIWKALKKARVKKRKKVRRVILILGVAVFFFSSIIYNGEKEERRNLTYEKQLRELEEKIERGRDMWEIIKFLEEGEDVKDKREGEIYDKLLRYSMDRDMREQIEALAWISEQIEKEPMDKREEEKEDIYFLIGRAYTQLLFLGQKVKVTQREIEKYLDCSSFYMARQYRKLLQKNGTCSRAGEETQKICLSIAHYLDSLSVSRVCVEGRLSLMKFYEQIEDFSSIKNEWIMQQEKVERELEYLEKKGKDLTEEKKIFYENTLSYWIKMEENQDEEKEEEREYVKMQISCIKQLERFTTYKEQLEWKKREFFLTRIMLENNWISLTEKSDKIRKLKEELEIWIDLYQTDVELYSEYGLFLLHIEEDLDRAKYIYKKALSLRGEQSEKFFLLEEEIMERTQEMDAS